MQVQIQALCSTHDCKAFDCGTPPLNEWLVKMASQQQRRNIARSFVLIDVSAPERVLGYYTLTVSEIGRSAFPDQNKYPRQVPIVKLGRFAVDKNRHGQGLGEMLLLNALERIAEVSLQAGLAAVMVDAKDAGVATFYQRFGFLPSPENPLQLFLPIKSLQGACRQAALAK